MISTHILDLANGNPAANVRVTLELLDGDSFRTLRTEKTNDDGRIVFDCERQPGTYQLNFGIAEYARKNRADIFFTTATVTFHITDVNRKYHVPLLLSPFGYSTYRGS